MTCESCGGPLRERSDRRVRYCSLACAGVAKRGVPLTAHPLFKGGLAFDTAERRWKVMCRDGTQIRYARAVMAAQVGRLLRPDEIVHHRNEDTTDDRPENLEITTRSAHIEMHRAKLAR